LKAACELYGLKVVETNVKSDPNDPYSVVASELDAVSPSELKGVCEMFGLKIIATEVDRGDGRKVHYGSGRQPLDDIKEDDCGGAFAYGNVLKYLRRAKDIKHSHQSSRFYWRFLEQLSKDDPYGRSPTNAELYDRLREHKLTPNELAIVTATEE